MVRILIVAIDTRGGVEPLRALARALRRAGLSVVLAAPADLASSDRPDGVEEIPLPGSMRESVERLGSTQGVMRAPKGLRKELLDRTASAVSTILARGRTWDLVLAGVGGATVAAAIARAQGARFLSTPLQPIGPATQAWPGVLAPPVLQAPGLRRRAGHAVSSRLVGLPAAGTAATALAAAGVGTRTPLRRLPGAVYGYSSLVVPQPTEWPADRVAAGYWRAPEDEAPLDRDLTAFLDAHGPPIVVGFGSMRARDPADVVSAIARAGARIGAPLVLLEGWGGEIVRPDVSTPTFIAKEAPHHQLFSRSRIAVHHGGAGTTAATLTAGLPTVTIPFAADQPFWGRRTHDLGAGPAPIPITRLTEDRLTAALEEADSAAVRRTADAVGRRLRDEDGLSTGVEQILRRATEARDDRAR